MSPLRTTGLALSVVVVVAAVAAVIANRSDGDGQPEHAGRSTTTAGPTTGPTTQTSAPRCSGVPMRSGQRDIDAAPPGTTFCLSGTHNWTLTPKSGDRFIGPAILDGQNTTTIAFLGNGTSNVTLANLEIRNYRAGDQEAAISAHGTTGWVFRNLQVHDNGTSATVAPARTSASTRGSSAAATTTIAPSASAVAAAPTAGSSTAPRSTTTTSPNNTYTKRNISCGYEAGGVKWTADNTTVKNSKIHDNACKGLWADLNADNAKIVDNDVYGNWDEGIFIEISSGATVTGNTVTGNGLTELQRRRLRLPVAVGRRHHARQLRPRRGRATTRSRGTATASPARSRPVPTASRACWRTSPSTTT